MTSTEKKPICHHHWSWNGSNQLLSGLGMHGQIARDRESHLQHRTAVVSAAPRGARSRELTPSTILKDEYEHNLEVEVITPCIQCLTAPEL